MFDTEQCRHQHFAMDGDTNRVSARIENMTTPDRNGAGITKAKQAILGRRVDARDVAEEREGKGRLSDGSRSR